ncbi:hypothetical protein DPEC_G00248540 [Dallia pectoralis]|uniref:Uncharacterized protein n=1 Tax=Dallia pectoralis TaxID=75939 RepID=A0ACC2FWN1_DALPE|nr:hypothetical protein DPEC_G00248540 [Dallia pectoralis]
MDDITIVGTDSRSITTATKAVDDYCAATGALVNRETIKLLGITFQRDGGSTSWAETICPVQRKICEWSARSFTMTVYKAIGDFAFGSGLSTAGLASWKYKDIMGHIRSKDTVAPSEPAQL